MLLKLVMPHVDRTIEGGSIIKWYKAEGERVDYGDDLFDMRVEEVKITKLIKAPGDICVRITSSDMGIMGKIYAKEGKYRDVGSLLAVLTTEEDELIDGADKAIKEASLFRVVANHILE